MPTKFTTAKGIRIKDEVIERLKERAKRKKWSFNRYVNFALETILRPHRKREK